MSCDTVREPLDIQDGRLGGAGGCPWILGTMG